MNNKIPTIMPGAEPIYYEGDNEIGCLILHGLTASPAEVSWLADYLNDQGMTVHVPRLNGHGADHRQLRYINWQDWYLSALDGYHVLRQNCRLLYVVGFSMGGLLTLLMAASEELDGIVVMAAPVRLNDSFMLRMARWIKYFRPYIHLPDRSDFPMRLRQEQERRGEPILGRVRYDTWAYHALEEISKLAKLVDRNLSVITEPALLLYSTADSTVSIANQSYIHKRLSSQIIETHTYQRSDHILPQDSEHEDVFERTAQFITQQAAMKSF